MNSFTCAFSLLVGVVLGMSDVEGQSGLCENGYMPFNEGATFELTSYNQKGKVTSAVLHSVGDVTEVPGGYKAEILTKIFDEKGNPSLDGQYFLECRNDGVYLDISSMLNPQSMAAFSSMQVEMTGDALSLPNKMAPGQTLPDGQMEMKASMNGMALMSMNMHITDRKVTGKETRTTGAGTFECLIISQKTSVEGFGRNTYESKSWYARGVGMVRSESYDKKGNISSYTELTRFNK